MDNMPEGVNKSDIVCYNNMIESSRKYVEKNFNWEVISKKLTRKVNGLLQ